MAIAPPSDLVLDVVQAADPAQVLEAQERLNSTRATNDAVRLASSDEGFAATVGKLDSRENMRARFQADDDKAVPATYRKFEAMVLQNFVKSMLPENSEEIYGKGNTGDIWKSMMAEQIAGVMSQGRGIGIAEHMMPAGEAESLKNKSKRMAEIEGYNGDAASRMVQSYQMKSLDKLISDVEPKQES